MNNKKEVEREELHKTIWKIANELRGSVDGWDFKQYVLGLLFYRFISENIENYVNDNQRKAGLENFEYKNINDEEALLGKTQILEEKGLFILPSELFCNVRKNADKNENLNAEGGEIQHIDEKSGDDIGENAEELPELTGYEKHLNESMSEKGYMAALKDSGYNIEQQLAAYSRGRQTGLQTLHNMVKGLFIDDKTGEMSAQFTQDFSKLHTIQEVIDKLNEVLRAMPDLPIRERLYGAFVDVIDKMALKNELPQHGVRPPVKSTLDSLTDFIQENINHPALKSLDSFNATNLLQSLLNAPGVFTPLAHYILPLDVDGTKAFGELWVDNDENNPNNTPGTQRNYHLFLTFDVESIGRFEVDLYALGDEVNLTLLYPQRFEKQIEPMKDRINKVVRNVGYNTRTFETAPLKTPHNLTEIFPKIVDKRTTLNTRV